MYKNIEGKNSRSCILIKKHINFLDNYSDKDFPSVIMGRSWNKPICLCSAYCPYEELEIFPSMNFVRAAEESKWICVMVCDNNAKKKKNNVRGELLFSYLIKLNLFLCNKGDKATFFKKKIVKSVYLTLISFVTY